jgi:glutamine amidotransferase
MKRAPRIAVFDYGMGNIRSVAKAIEHVGGRPVVTSSRREAAKGSGAVLPGVGAFGACMRGLVETGLDWAILNYVEAGDRPLLGVCLGMQVLFEASDEGEEAGLEFMPGRVKRISGDVKVPHMGWNDVTWTKSHPLIEGIPSGTSFYFVHSYAPDPDPDNTIGVTEYGRPFAAAVANGVLFATQFHPEKSGDAGLQIYENLVKAAA